MSPVRPRSGLSNPATPSSSAPSAAVSWWTALRRWWRGAPPVSQPPERPANATPPRTAPLASSAQDEPAYRQDAARHLYACYQERIFQGRLPEGLHAIGVLAVDIGPAGEVEGLDWLRAPRHAPEVVAEIEQLVRAAAPFPAPLALGGAGSVGYVDTWLWDASGQFQLDTLTEGQGA